MAEWTRLAATTIADYAKGVEDELMAERIIPAMLKANNRIKYNCGGDGFKWQVPYRQIPLIVDDFETPVTPTRKDRFKQPSLDYIMYRMDDFLSKREYMKNRGPGQLVNYFKEMAPRLLDDFSGRLHEEFYIDSGATGNSGRMSGIETFMGFTEAVNITSSTSATRALGTEADIAAAPTDTYAGLACTRGSYGGSWDAGGSILTTWPSGHGDLAYDFWTPIILHYNSTSFSGSADTWQAQCLEVIGYLTTYLARYATKRKAPKVGVLDRTLYAQLKTAASAYQKIEVSSNNTLKALGFLETMVVDGAEWTWEWGVPSGVGYLFSIDKVTLRSMQEKLIVTDGPWYEKLQRGYVTLADFGGQLQFAAPRFFGKVMDISP